MLSKLFKSSKDEYLESLSNLRPQKVNSLSGAPESSFDRNLVFEWSSWKGRYAHWIMGLSAGVCNVICFTRYRMLFKVTNQSSLFYLVPALVALSTSFLHESFVVSPLIDRTATCLTCLSAQTHLIQSVHGFAIPTLAASLLTMYSSIGKFKVPFPQSLLDRPTNFRLATRHLWSVTKSNNLTSIIGAMFVVNLLLTLYLSSVQQNDLLRTMKTLSKVDRNTKEIL